MFGTQSTPTLRAPSVEDAVSQFAHPIVKLTDEELTRVIGGFEAFSGTSGSSVSSSASGCDGTKVCCCEQ
jgi:hypothetical protein